VDADNRLGTFLKARRALVTPEDAGLTGYGRRRVAGLRRDELAGLAGVSRDYLMRLEQGRDRHPSAQVLDALAGALRLDPDATAHLHALAGLRPGRPAAGPDPVVSEDLRRLLDAWPDAPAYVRGRTLDVLAANRLAGALSPMYKPGRNLAADIFLTPEARELFPRWEQIAAQTVAALRAAAEPDDPALAGLVAELSADADFRRLWARHDVRPTRDELKLFRHPLAGPLELRRQSLAVAGTGQQSIGQQTIIVYQAEPGSPSAAALASL
jgi:transcriptional regulator with XRE-family HTH domain